MRAADQLLELDDADSALSTEITRTRIAPRTNAGPLPSLFGRSAVEVDPDAPPTWIDGPETLTARPHEQTMARLRRQLPIPPSLLAWTQAEPGPTSVRD